MLRIRLLHLTRLFRAQWVVYSLKLISLAIAFACAILIISFASSEFTVNSELADADKIFRVLRRNNASDFGRNRLSNRVSRPVYNFIQSMRAAPVIARVKILEKTTAFAGTRKISTRVHATDSSINHVIRFRFIDGEPGDLGLAECFLSSTTSQALFGTTHSSGMTLKIATATDTIVCKVKGVFGDFDNTHEAFNLFVTLGDEHLAQLGYQPNNFCIYGRTNKDDIARLNSVLEQHPFETDISYRLQSFDDVYFGPRVTGEVARHGDFYSIWILLCITGLIVVLAITNYANLTTLTLPARSTELAISKVAGAASSTVCIRLLEESMAMCLCALASGAGIVFLASPALQTWFSLDVSAWLAEVSAGSVAAMMLVVFIAFVVPLYPIVVFTTANPRRLLSADIISFPRFKRVITTLQLGTSISLIVAGMVISRQIERSLIKEPGRNHDQVVYLRYPKELTRLDELKLGWKRYNPNIVGVTAASQMPDNLLKKDSAGRYHLITIDHDFFEFFDIGILSGRTFRANDRDSVMSNLSGSDIVTTKPIGIVEDFSAQFNQPDRPIEIRQTNDYRDYDFLFIRILEVNIRDTQAYLLRFFGEITADPVKLTFLDRGYETMLQYEDTLNGLSRLLTFVGIAMACCAIYALSLSRLNDNLKQIAIRRTFGASRSQVILLLSREFFEQLLAACFLFGPITFLLLREWLKNFVYAAHMHWADPLIGLIACVLIIAVTNSSLVLRLGKRSTSEALRR